MNIIGLKLCPFCNSEAELSIYGDSHGGNHDHYRVHCSKCKCSNGEDCYSEEQAYSLWNTRDGITYDAIQLTLLRAGNFYAAVVTDRSKLKFHHASRKLPHPNEQIFIFNKDKTESKHSRFVFIGGYLNIKCWEKSGHKPSANGPIGYDFKDYPLWIKKEDIPEMKLIKDVQPPHPFDKIMTFK